MVRLEPSTAALGFFSPFDSLKFFQQHKSLLFLGMAPHLAGLVSFCLFIKKKALIWILEGVSRVEFLSHWSPENVPDWTAWTLSVLLGLVSYGFIGVALVNVLASPLLDWISERAFKHVSDYPIPDLNLRFMLRSFFVEIVKSLLLLWIFLLGTLFPIFSPFVFVIFLWFAGFQYLDRTLLLLGMRAVERVKFGVRYAIPSAALGVWTFIPLLGTLFSFVMVASGGIIVGKLMPREKKGQP